MRLAGTYHPLAYLMERVWETLPGVADVSGCWRTYDGKLKYQLSDSLTSLSQEQEVFLQKFRNRKISHIWLEDVNLFAEPKYTTLTLDNEQNLNSLALFFDSPVDQLKDILVINFSAQIGVKNADLDFKALTTNEKYLMSTFITQQLQAEFKRVVSERTILNHFSKTTIAQQQNLSLVEEKLRETDLKYKHAITNLMTSVKNELSEQYGKKITFKEGVIQRLAAEELTFEALKDVLYQAVATAYHLNLFSTEVEISPEFLHLSVEKKNDIASPSSLRKDKVYLLLDRYEDGAVQALQKGLVVNGKNVAANLDEPVSPPAITDALKKNQKRIRFLLNEYPHHWSNIRKGLRPLALLDENNNNGGRLAVG